MCREGNQAMVSMRVWLCVSGGKSGDGEYGVSEWIFQELACNQFQATSVAQYFFAHLLMIG